MRTWMLLWVAAASLVLASPVLAESPEAAADDGLGLDFDDSGVGLEPAPEPIAEAAPSAAVDAEPATAEEPVEPAMAESTPESGGDAAAMDAAEGVEAVAATGETDEAGIEAIDETAATDDVEEVAPQTAPAPSRDIAIGPMGVDDEGRVGRIHTVSTGDTLWDISNAYLGTPWVWPSVWNDNDGISNPHRIAPGDHIWITSGEMRIVTDSQRDDLMNGVPEDVATEETLFEPEDDAPAALGDDDELMAAAEPTEMDELPVAVPAAAPDASPTGAMVRVSEAESLGYVSPDTIEAASSIVDSSVPRTWLADGDEIYIGLGEGEVQPGDDFTIYRDADPVRDLDGTLLGYHVEVLGWARVRAVEAESSKAEIRISMSEIRRGDMVIPRDPVNISVPLKRSPDAVPGNIVYMPDSRTAMGDGEWVYVNRGNLHGVEPGTELEVYDAGRFMMDKGKGQKVLTPDHIVAQLIVVDTQPDSAVAYIVHTRRDLSIGDKVRPTAKKLAQR